MPSQISKRTLTVLGCDGSFPGPGGAASGYLIDAGPTTVWVDAGSGTFANLQLIRDPASIDAIVLSHEHPDHWSDVESFAVWAWGHSERGAVPVYGPPGLRQRAYFRDVESLDWHSVEPSEQLVIGSLSLRFAATDHGPLTLAMRIEDAHDEASADQALAYTADTGADWTVAELGTGLGTVLSEATFTRKDEKPYHRHLSGHQAGTMAASAGVQRLILTHRWPTVSADALGAEAAAAFGGPVEQAATGNVYRW